MSKAIDLQLNRQSSPLSPIELHRSFVVAVFYFLCICRFYTLKQQMAPETQCADVFWGGIFLLGSGRWPAGSGTGFRAQDVHEEHFESLPQGQNYSQIFFVILLLSLETHCCIYIDFFFTFLFTQLLVSNPAAVNITHLLCLRVFLMDQVHLRRESRRILLCQAQARAVVPRWLR